MVKTPTHHCFWRYDRPMNKAALRLQIVHLGQKAGVSKCHPHRFRHTFGADMVRGGISLPALMHLMGHASIQTTMLYVQLSPGDVWAEFDRVTRSIHREEIRIKDHAPQ